MNTLRSSSWCAAVWCSVWLMGLSGCQTSRPTGPEREGVVDAALTQPQPPKPPPATPIRDPRPEFQQESPRSQ